MTSDFNINAWQYALGELSEEQVVVFERELETSQEAREALADAVILISALRQSEGALAISSPKSAPAKLAAVQAKPAPARSAALALVTGLAACLLMAIVVGLSRPDADGVLAVHPVSEGSAIVGAWAELGADDALQAEFASDSLIDDGSDDVPDWMVAAVLIEDSAPSVGSPPLNEGAL